jgi:WD40 repeat protein
VGYGGGFVTLYATQTGKELRSATIPGRPIVEDVQFLGGTGQLAVASSKGLYLWSLAGTPGCCRRVSPLWTDSVSADPRDPLKVVVINTKGTMTWNLAGTLRSILISPYSVHDAAFSPDSREVVTASQDGMVRVWYAQPRELGADFTDSYAGGSTEPLDGAAYMGTSDRIAALGYAGKVHVFSPDGGTPTSVGAAVDDMAWDLAGTEMATATSDGVVNLWHATGSGYVEATLPSPIDVSDMLNLSLSWDGSRLAIQTSGYTIQVRSTQTGRLLQTITSRNSRLHGMRRNLERRPGQPVALSRGAGGRAAHHPHAHAGRAARVPQRHQQLSRSPGRPASQWAGARRH